MTVKEKIFVVDTIDECSSTYRAETIKWSLLNKNSVTILKVVDGNRETMYYPLNNIVNFGYKYQYNHEVDPEWEADMIKFMSEDNDEHIL